MPYMSHGCWAEQSAHDHPDGECPYVCPKCGHRLPGACGHGAPCYCKGDNAARLAEAIVDGGGSGEMAAEVFLALREAKINSGEA
jgi:hypothetical protein